MDNYYIELITTRVLDEFSDLLDSVENSDENPNFLSAKTRIDGVCIGESIYEIQILITRDPDDLNSNSNGDHT